MARKKRLAPKPKRDKKSWQVRNAVRQPKQQRYAAAVAQMSEPTGQA